MKSDLFDRSTACIGRMVVNHPGRIAVVFSVLTVILFLPVTWMDTSTSMSDFTPESRFIKADGILRTEFNTTDSVIGILDAGSGSVLSREALILMTNIEDGIRNDERISPYLAGCGDPVASISDPVAAAVLMISNGTFRIEDAPEEMLDMAVSLVLQDREYSKLVSDDDRYAVIIFRLRHDMIPRDDESVEVRMNELMEGMDLRGLDYYSFSALNSRMKEDAISSLSLLLPVSIVMVIVVLAFGLRSLPNLIASLIGIASTVVMSFGMFSLLGLRFSQMMFFSPIVIIVLCIDYGIHVLFRDREFLEKGEPPQVSMKNAIRFMGISIALSMITTALAFGSNSLSAIPAVSSFGLFLAIGIFISFMVMMFFVPSLVLLYRRVFWKEKKIIKGKRSNSGGPSRISRKLVSIFWKVPYVFLIAAFLLAGSGLYFGLRIDQDMTARDVTSTDSPLVRAADVLDKEFKGLGGETCQVIVMGDISDPGVLEALNLSVNSMMDDRHISDVDGSVRSVIPAVKQVFAGSGAPDLDGNGLPDSREVTLAILNHLYEHGLGDQVPPGEIRSLLSRSEGGFDGTVVIVSSVNVSGPAGGALLRELEDDMEPLEGKAKIFYAGFLFERYDMLERMIDGMSRSTIATTLLVTVLVILLFRSFRYGIITSIPIVLVIGWIMGVMALTGYKWNMVTVTITSMTVGVGIDHSIHLVERYRQEKRSKEDIREAMSTAIATTGGSLFAAAATTFGGFFVMAFSDIGMYNAFGVLTSLMILFAFFSSVLVLPPAILWVDRVRNSKRPGCPGTPGTDIERS
ncbi:MAG: MMPL family transporter [Candidatus Thermoplasmatota archaeon]|nr:MMPL family transporter [Candidatus Thermoplasmatota archaeon]